MCSSKSFGKLGTLNNFFFLNCKPGIFIKIGLGVVLVGASLKETSFEFPRDGTLFPWKWNRSQSETELPFF